MCGWRFLAYVGQQGIIEKLNTTASHMSNTGPAVVDYLAGFRSRFSLILVEMGKDSRENRFRALILQQSGPNIAKKSFLHPLAELPAHKPGRLAGHAEALL